MNIVIVEDEKLSAEHLTTMLQRIDASFRIVASFDSVRSTVAAFQQGLQADMLFLDIHLADGNGFDIFKSLQLDIPIIFTTAYHEYAIQAFQVNSVDYLLKPVGIQELKRAVEKLRKYNQMPSQVFPDAMADVFQNLTKTYKARFLVKSGQQIESIKTDDVIHFITLDSITFLVISNGKKYPVDYTLDQLEELLSPQSFFRINRKVIIHIKSIEKVTTYFNSRLQISTKLLDTEACVVSRDRVNDFKSWLDQ